MPAHWGIVGGGLLGMTIARRLARAGQRATLCEAADHLGGLAGAWKLGDVIWDRYYHVTLLSDSYTRALLGELGLEDEMRWVETRSAFYTEGRLCPMSNTWEFLRFPPLNILEKLRLALTIFCASKRRDPRRLEKVLVADWLRRWSGWRTFDKVWRPLLESKLGEHYRSTSASFIWATIARMYAARRGGAKKEMFGYAPGGYRRIVDRFAELLAEDDVSIRLNRTVRCVRSGAGDVISVEFHDGRVESFDRLVMTVPCPITARACPELAPSERDTLHNVRYLGIVCASLLLKRPLAGFYATNITDPGVPFTGVIEMSALVDRTAFGGRSLIYLPRYVSSDSPLFEEPDDEIQARFLSPLSRIYPHIAQDDVTAFRVSRARYVMAIPTLRYSERVPGVETSIPGLYIVNSAQIVNATLNVNETVRLAEEVSARLLESSVNGDPSVNRQSRRHV